MNKIFRLPVHLSLVLLMSVMTLGCSRLPWAYTLPIIQGNELEQSQVDQLEIGMSEDQVRFLLGTPMINDPFHSNRWDYNFYDMKKHKIIKKYHVAVFFEYGAVSRIQKDGI